MTHIASMNYALHFGVDAGDLLALTRVLRSGHTGPGLPFAVDGDGWNCWGEAVGTDVNDETTLHVIVGLDRKMHARLTLGVLAAQKIRLAPMGGYAKQEGILAVLTDMADFGCLDGDEGDEYTRSWYTVCPDPDCGRDHHGKARS